MNRKIYLLLVLCFLMKGGLVYASADQEKAVFQVLERVTGNKDLSGKSFWRKNVQNRILFSNIIRKTGFCMFPDQIMWHCAVVSMII